MYNKHVILNNGVFYRFWHTSCIDRTAIEDEIKMINDNLNKQLITNNQGGIMKKGILVIFAIAAVVALSVTAYAGRGMMGYGSGGGECPGVRGGGYGAGSGYMMGNLSEDDAKKINDERDTFFKATEELRQDIYAKELELNSELAKKNIDAGKAANIQKEISELESKFDQKRLDHMIKMKKLNPNLARGLGMRGGMGGGYQGGPCGR